MAKDEGAFRAHYSAFRGGRKGSLVNNVKEPGPSPKGNKPANQFKPKKGMKGSK